MKEANIDFMIICGKCGGIFEGDPERWPDYKYVCDNCVKIEKLGKSQIDKDKLIEEMLIKVTSMLDKRFR